MKARRNQAGEQCDRTEDHKHDPPVVPPFNAGAGGHAHVRRGPAQVMIVEVSANADRAKEDCEETNPCLRPHTLQYLAGCSGVVDRQCKGCVKPIREDTKRSRLCPAPA